MNKQVKVPWSGWEITKVLGSGSFGSVYEIQRNVLGTITKAAMKVISVPRDTADLNDLISIGYDKESINARFLDELKGISNEYNMMDQLKGNANIIYCEDLYYEEKPDGYGYDLYIRMELLEPLIKAIPNPATEDQVIKLGIDMCNALSACKKHKIIHRDIKPSNILISKDGNFKLGDFGVSKTSERTAGGTKTGTYGFMAPEVYNNKPYNASVDIYSLGMVLYWMLNRRCGPFLPLPPTIPMAHQIDEAKQRRFNGEPIPAPIDGSDELKAIVLKACAFDPDERYSSPEELSAELEKLKYSSTVSNNDTISSLRPQQSTSQYESSYDERTMGNNWGYTDEPTQGTQYGGEEIEQGGTVGRSDLGTEKNNSVIANNDKSAGASDDTANSPFVKSTYDGKITEVFVSNGDQVRKGDLIARMESDNRIYDIVAHRDGYMDHVFVKPGYTMQSGLILATIFNSSVNKKGVSSSSGFDVTKTVTLTDEEVKTGAYKKIDVDNRIVEIPIPSGTFDGETKRYNGQGRIDPETGAKGDLIIKIVVRSEGKKKDFWDKSESTSDTDLYDDEVVLRPIVSNLGGTYRTINRNTVEIPKGVKNGDIIDRVKVYIHEPYIWKTQTEKLNKKDLALLETLPSAVLKSEYLFISPQSDISKLSTTAITCLVLGIILCFLKPYTALFFILVAVGCGIAMLCKLPKYLKMKKNAKLISQKTIDILTSRGVKLY